MKKKIKKAMSTPKMQFDIGVNKEIEERKKKKALEQSENAENTGDKAGTTSILKAAGNKKPIKSAKTV